MELTDLPASLDDNPQVHLLALCSKFLREIDEYTSGKPSYNPKNRTFLRDVLKYYTALKYAIEKTRPEFDIEPLEVPVCQLLKDTSSSAGEVPKITLTNVSDAISEMSYRQLYGITPFEVHENFIRSFVFEWEAICMESFVTMEKILRRQIVDICDRHFGRFRSCGLLSAAT
jgi:hypothetical protein